MKVAAADKFIPSPLVKISYLNPYLKIKIIQSLSMIGLSLSELDISEGPFMINLSDQLLGTPVIAYFEYLMRILFLIQLDSA